MIQITQKAGPASFATVMNGYSNCRDSEHDRADSNTHAILVQGSLLSYSPVAAHMLHANVYGVYVFLRVEY